MAPVFVGAPQAATIRLGEDDIKLLQYAARCVETHSTDTGLGIPEQYHPLLRSLAGQLLMRIIDAAVPGFDARRTRAEGRSRTPDSPGWWIKDTATGSDYGPYRSWSMARKRASHHQDLGKQVKVVVVS